MLASFYALQLFFLTLLSYEDYRTKHVSLGMLLLFALTMGGLIFLNHPFDYPLVLGVLGFLIFLKMLVFLGARTSLIGNGDLILLLPLLLSIERSELSLFLILAGLGGVIMNALSASKEAPFVPALSISYGTVLLLRHL